MVWDYAGRHPQYRAGQIVFKHTKNAQFRDAVNRALDLVETLLTKKFKSPTEIRKYFVIGKESLFSPRMSEKVYRKLYRKTGGGPNDGLISDLVVNGANGLVGTIFGSNPAESDLHNTMFFLKGIETSGITLLPFVPVTLISSSVEIFVEFLLSAAIGVDELGPWLGLLPLPGAGAVGAVIGEAIKAVLAFIAAAIATSRKDFETAFEAMLLSIPIAGVMLTRAYRSEEKLTAKYKARVSEALNQLPDIQEMVMRAPPEVPGADTLAEIASRPSTIAGTRRKRVKHRRTVKHKWTRRQ